MHRNIISHNSSESSEDKLKYEESQALVWFDTGARKTDVGATSSIDEAHSHSTAA